MALSVKYVTCERCGIGVLWPVLLKKSSTSLDSAMLSIILSAFMPLVSKLRGNVFK